MRNEFSVCQFFEDGTSEYVRRWVWKRCKGCDRRVKLRPDYAYCNACADKIERGGDF